MTTSSLSELALKGDYCLDWDEFVGQAQAKRMLRIAATSAERRSTRLGHTLLRSRVPGIGKTSLALLTAAQMGTHVEVVSGKLTLNEARIKLSGMTDGDILLVEECHKLVDGGKASAEWLLNYMQDGVLVGPLGSEEMPSVTIMGTTTDAGKLPEPILQRFELQPVLESYSDYEGMLIASSLSSRVFDCRLETPSDDVCAQIANASSNQPRTMRRLLSAIRDLVTVGEMAETEDYDLTEALAWTGLTADGLTEIAQRYITVLFSEFHGQAGLKPILDRVGEGGKLAEEERLLMDKGMLAKTAGGRMLTQVGIQRARQLIAAQKAA